MVGTVLKPCVCIVSFNPPNSSIRCFHYFTLQELTVSKFTLLQYLEALRFRAGFEAGVC